VPYMDDILFYHNINIILTHARINTINFAGQMDSFHLKAPQMRNKYEIELEFWTCSYYHYFILNFF
jgi:hypothetical protein